MWKSRVVVFTESPPKLCSSGCFSKTRTAGSRAPKYPLPESAERNAQCACTSPATSSMVHPEWVSISSARVRRFPFDVGSSVSPLLYHFSVLFSLFVRKSACVDFLDVTSCNWKSNRWRTSLRRTIHFWMFLVTLLSDLSLIGRYRCMKVSPGISNQYLYRSLYSVQAFHCLRHFPRDQVLYAGDLFFCFFALACRLQLELSAL